MLTLVRYLPILTASMVMICSFLFKILSDELKLTSLFRDIILFFVLYHAVRMLTINVEKILKNYWKIL
ncbi:MAG: hypothetical protein LBH05_05805 [Deferribacteraceae bacterium]|jgi:hypothetical protein|nr:hypothetical protein [Deferribacteraceae bacterium]